MFTYQHLRDDLLPVSLGGGGATTNFRMDGGVYVDGEVISIFPSSFSETYRESWSATTYPRSATSHPKTTFYSYTDTNGNSGLYPNGETSGSAALAGYSTGVDSHTFTAPATQTYSFTTQYFSNTATTLSASAAATRTTTGSRTLTMSGVTTLVPIPGFSDWMETRWFVARELPFGASGLRKVGLAYGIGEVGGTTGSRTVASLSTGAQTYNSTRNVSTSTSDTLGTTKYIRLTTYGAVAMGAGRATARRRRYQGGAFFGTNGTSGTAMSWDFFNQMVNPTIAPDFSPFVSIGAGVFSRRIFTQIERSIGSSHYSIAGSSAYLCWSYISSSWKLFATKTNSTTSTTLEISLLTSSSAQTTTGGATIAIGLVNNSNSPATFILGPLVPFSTLSFNEISVTRSASNYTSRTFVLFSGSGTTGTAASSSSAHAASTSFSFSDGTTNSNLPFYASAPAVSITTSSVDAFYVNGFDVTIYKNSKWNEAGRGDPVSVDQ